MRSPWYLHTNHKPSLLNASFVPDANQSSRVTRNDPTNSAHAPFASRLTRSFIQDSISCNSAAPSTVSFGRLSTTASPLRNPRASFTATRPSYTTPNDPSPI